MSDEHVARLFTVGGPVPPDLVIGRGGEIEEIARRLREGISTMVIGARRIGKTTVCEAVCDQIKDDGALVVQIDVPERPDSQALLQMIIDRCSRLSLQAAAAEAGRVARPLIEQILAEAGVPLDLSTLSAAREPHRMPSRDVLGLPAELARRERRRALVFLDELQRVAGYDDGEQILTDLIDLYGGAADVVLLVDGSEERALAEMLGPPVHFGKLVDRLDLDPRIAPHVWREPLTERFGRAGLVLPPDRLEEIIGWGEGQPYRTMAAARYTAFAARRTGTLEIDAFDVTAGIDEARRHLEDDGA